MIFGGTHLPHEHFGSLMLRWPREARASKHPSFSSVTVAWPFEARLCRAPQGEGKTFAQAPPPVGIAPSGSSMLVSDEAPEATCLSMYVAPSGASFGVYSRCMRLSGKAATGAGTGVPTSTGRGSGCNVIRDDASAWPVAREVPAGWCTIPTGTLARGMKPWSFPTLAHHPRRLFRSAVWVFATARAPCLCASEARPSDQGIQVLGTSDPITFVKPFVRRETVAAGRGFRSATPHHPGAGPASPDIASSGVSEGGTGIRVRREKWAGMKKLCFVDFVGGFLEFIPSF
jgi:hypothetical protein